MSIQQFGNWLKFPAKKSRREAVKTVYIRHIWFAAVAERPVYDAHAERVKGYALMLVIHAADYRDVVPGQHHFLYGVSVHADEGAFKQIELRTELRTLVGGRAAEQVVFGVQTTGAANDIQRATALARNMVTQYGMSDKFGLMTTASVQNQYLDGQAYMDCSQETAAQVDKEVLKLLDAAYADAKRILTENRQLLDEISEFLLVKETITGDELMAYVNADKNALPQGEETPKEE